MDSGSGSTPRHVVALARLSVFHRMHSTETLWCDWHAVAVGFHRGSWDTRTRGSIAQKYAKIKNLGERVRIMPASTPYFCGSKNVSEVTYHTASRLAVCI